MSNLKVTNIEKANGDPIDFTKQEGIKAAIRLDMSSGSNLWSMNVSSIVDSGTGRFNINLTNSFNSIDDAIVTAGGHRHYAWANSGQATKMNSASQVFTHHVENGTGYDAPSFALNVLGDLA